MKPVTEVESLKVLGIKNAFEHLTYLEQVLLLKDLMKTTKLNSIIYPERPMFEDPSDPDYRDSFILYCMAFWSVHIIVITEEYVDNCFDIWKLLEKESVGDVCGYTCDPGDWFLSSEDLCCTDGCNTVIESDDERKRIFTETIFSETHIELVQLVHRFPLTSTAENGKITYAQFNLKLTDLFRLVHSNPEHAHIALTLLGYFKTDHIRREKCLVMFMKMFPEFHTLEEIIRDEKNNEKLFELFHVSLS